MKIQVVSDLHIEFGPITLPPIERDLLILAGDINIGTRALKFIKKQLQISPVLYVLGNHEFYHRNFQQVHKNWNSIKEEGLYFLERDQAILPEFHNIRFLGATLWTDFGKSNPKYMKKAQYDMSDFQIIEFQERQLLPRDTIEEFNRTISWLESKMKDPTWDPNTHKARKTIVVTHHMPSFQSVAPQYYGDPLNYAFASSLDALIQKYIPDIWIHGHTHASFDYQLGHTRVLCNPRGYCTFQPNFAFDPNFVVEI